MILLVDDDPDAHATVVIALGAAYQVPVCATLSEALRFVRLNYLSIRGVIVDLNLVPGRTDNFGSEILTQLRELNIPCIIFSSSISSDDAERQRQVEWYRNQFGVLNALGKQHVDAHQALRELRSSTAEMVGLSLEKRRGDVRSELEAFVKAGRDQIAREHLRLEQVSKRAGQIAGRAANERFARDSDKAELARSRQLQETAAVLAARLARASSFETLDALSHELGLATEK